MAGRSRRGFEEEQRTRKKTRKQKQKVVFQDSSEDSDANEDLTVGIMEKAKRKKTVMEEEDLKEADSPDSSAVIDISSSEDIEIIGLAATVKPESLKEKRKRMKKGDADNEDARVADGTPTVDKNLEVPEPPEAVAGELTMSDNTVLRKLLRGPRYFDPPDESWGACYSCGEVGHSAAKCLLKKHKPCYICGTLGHVAQSCPELRTCFICKKTGHHAKKCLERHNVEKEASRVCLRCGNPGHDMLTCRNDYDLDDLKEIQCYVCRQYGHLCCVDYVVSGPRVVSCYKCGQTGHTGLGCARDRSRRVSTLCYKCGEEGHLARGCNMFDQYDPRSSEPLTPQCLPPEDLGFLQFRSVPHNLGKSKGEENLLQYKEDTCFTAGKFRPVNHWRTSTQGYLSVNGWGSPATPLTKGPKYQLPAFKNSISRSGEHHSSQTPISRKQIYASDASGSSKHRRHVKFADPNFSSSKRNEGFKYGIDTRWSQ